MARTRSSYRNGRDPPLPNETSSIRKVKRINNAKRNVSQKASAAILAAASQIDTSPQPYFDTPLGKLPKELRIHIFKYALAGNKIVRHCRVASMQRAPRDGDFRPEIIYHEKPWNLRYPKEKPLTLLFVCRDLYNDARDLILPHLKVEIKFDKRGRRWKRYRHAPPEYSLFHREILPDLRKIRHLKLEYGNGWPFYRPTTHMTIEIRATPGGMLWEVWTGRGPYSYHDGAELDKIDNYADMVAFRAMLPKDREIGCKVFRQRDKAGLQGLDEEAILMLIMGLDRKKV